MKFYNGKNNRYYWGIIYDNKLTAIHFDSTYYSVEFCKNGELHNIKNAAYIDNSGYKEFYLNDKCYFFRNDFTKESWRRFVKTQVFL